MQCVLLHGFTGDPAHWNDLRAADAIGPLADAVALGLPGHRGGPPVAASWDANLDAMAARLRALGDPADQIAIGYSLGARVALGLLARGDVRRAVLISVNPGIDDHERAARRAGDATWAALLRGAGLDAFLDAWQAQPLFASQARAPAARRAARRARRADLDAEALARSLETMGLAEMPDYRAAAAHAPLIVGADDAKFVAIARGLGVAFDQIADSGHDPTLEQPAALRRALDQAITRAWGMVRR